MVEISEAVKYPQVYFTRDSGLRPVIDKLFAKSGLQPKIAYEIEEDGAMAGLVEQNFGIAIMPDIPLLGQLQVEVLNFLNPGEPRYIYMAQLEGKYQPPMVEKFTRFVQRNRTL